MGDVSMVKVASKALVLKAAFEGEKEGSLDGLKL